MKCCSTSAWARHAIGMLGTYSLGMKQLAKLAQAIVHGPKLLILDEPTNGLDPPARARMIRLIREMKDSGEMHLVLCSHLLRDVEETCEEVLILKQGRIVHYSNLEDERSANKRFVEAGDFRRRRRIRGCADHARMRVRDSGLWSSEDGTARGIRDARDLSARRGAGFAITATELPARHAGGYFPEGDGSIGLATNDTEHE